MLPPLPVNLTFDDDSAQTEQRHWAKETQGRQGQREHKEVKDCPVEVGPSMEERWHRNFEQVRAFYKKNRSSNHAKRNVGAVVDV